MEKQEVMKFDAKAYSGKLDRIIDAQRAFYRTRVTKSAEFRIKQLTKLLNLVTANEGKIRTALEKDLGRDGFLNTFAVGTVIAEYKYALEHLLTIKPPFISRRVEKWMKPKKGRSPPLFLGNKVRIEPVPKGVVLIIGPWNYPFLLTMAPLMGAVAAGNCVVIKPSEVSPHTTSVIAELINNNFDPSFLHVEEVGVDESIVMTNKPQWDHIFFTGGTEIGRIIYQAAAKNLIPVTLELGGKSPTIIDKNVDLDLAAKRIAQMKFTNNGQTCMAPDYLLVHEEVKPPFVDLMKKYIRKFYGDDAKKSADYTRVVNRVKLERIVPLIDGENVVTGGEVDLDDNFMAPTLIDGVSGDSAVMQEEIFGPVLPIITWRETNEVVEFITSRPHPLALYIYSKDKQFQKEIMSRTDFGGGMINDSVLYYLHPEVPFGGVGDSGFGAYTGKYSFDVFTHMRPVVYAGGLVDRFLERTKIKFFRYPPGNKRKQKILKFFHRNLGRFRLF